MYLTVPEELRSRDRWVLWKAVDDGGRKPRKVPYRVEVEGRKASSKDPSTWTTYERALAVYVDNLNEYAGIGFVLGDGICGVDLDDCILPSGGFTPEAQAIINQADTYWEISPSKKGVKLFFLGDVKQGYNRPLGLGKIEAYGSNGRFFAFTGEGAKRAFTPILPELAVPREGDELVKDRSGNPPGYDECLAHILTMGESVEGQNGSAKMIAVACEILRRGMIHKVGWRLLKAYNAERALPPWPDDQLRHKWEDAQTIVMHDKELGTKVERDADEFDVIHPEDEAKKVASGEIPLHERRMFEWSELSTMDIKIDYLIDGLMVEGMNMVMGGREKTCKTGLAMDLLISLAMGVPFLGCYKVNRRVPSLMYTGEIGLALARDRLNFICKSKGVDPTHMRGSFMSPHMPSLVSEKGLALIVADLEYYKPKVAIFDPVYLGMGGADSSKLNEMGQLLRACASICLKREITPVLLHHSKKSFGADNDNSPMQLGDLSGAGFAEFARQWLLLNHNNPYNHGAFDLWLTTGGSGTAGEVKRVQIDEGFYDFSLQVDNRKWEVKVSDREDVDCEAEQVLEALTFKIGDGRGTVDQIRGYAELSKAKVEAALRRLVSEKKVFQQDKEFVLCQTTPTDAQPTNEIF